MEVVEHEQHRTPNGEHRQRVAGLAQHPLPRGAQDFLPQRFPVLPGEQRGELHQPGRGRGGKRVNHTRAIRSAAQPADRLEQGKERFLALEPFHALAVGNPDTVGGSHLPLELVGERRLADAGFP